MSQINKKNIVGKYFKIISLDKDKTCRALIQVLCEAESYFEIEIVKNLLLADYKNIEYFSKNHRPIFFRELKSRNFHRLQICSKSDAEHLIRHDTIFYSSLKDLIKNMSC